MPVRLVRLALTAAALSAATVAAAQGIGSPSYQFLEAVRSGDKDADVEKALAAPGTRIIDTQDPSTKDGALHIVARRGDARYTRYLLGKGADANLKNRAGDTPLLIAIDRGYDELVPILLSGVAPGRSKADPNLAGEGGQTPLIKAVMRHDETMVRLLLDAGADPDRRDYNAGKSARDYALADARYPVIAKMLSAAPKKVRRGVSGPTL